MVDGVEAEGPVRLELLLAEKLIARRLVREARVAALVVEHVIGLVAAERRFDIEQDALAAVGIEDTPDGAMRAVLVGDNAVVGHGTVDRARAAGDFRPRQVDAHAEIDARVAFEPDQRRKGERRIGLGVYGDDQLAAALQQLVDAEILDMAAIREIDDSPLLIELAENLEQQIKSVEEKAD